MVGVVEVVRMVEMIREVRVVEVVGVVEVATVVLVVGVFEEAKCPKKKKKRLTHFKTMPQAAGKKAKVVYFANSIATFPALLLYLTLL